MKIALGVGLILVATALVAQDAQMTPEQQAAKCEAEGGCAVFTQKEFMEYVREQFLRGLAMGVKSCRNAI